MDIQKIIDDLQNYACKLERLPVLISQLNKVIWDLDVPMDGVEASIAAVEEAAAVEEVGIFCDAILEAAQARNKELNELVIQLERWRQENAAKTA